MDKLQFYTVNEPYLHELHLKLHFLSQCMVELRTKIFGTVYYRVKILHTKSADVIFLTVYM